MFTITYRDVSVVLPVDKIYQLFLEKNVHAKVTPVTMELAYKVKLQ